MFTDPGNFNFNLKNLKVAKKINFKPFDYSQAGVYGSDEWKELGATGSEIEAEFDSVVERNESRTKK